MGRVGGGRRVYSMSSLSPSTSSARGSRGRADESSPTMSLICCSMASSSELDDETIERDDAEEYDEPDTLRGVPLASTAIPERATGIADDDDDEAPSAATGTEGVAATAGVAGAALAR